MTSIFDDISNAFRKSNNHSVQLILVCIMLFLGRIVIQFICNFFPNPEVSHAFVQNNLLLSTDWKVIITHPWTLLTYSFSSQGFLSLLFDMFAIFWFGNLLSDFLGGRKTLVTYFSGSIFSLILFFSINFILVKTGGNALGTGFLYGISPGIYSILFATVALLPNYELSFIRIFIKLKYIAIVFLFISFLSPIYGLLNLGGAVFGYLSIKFLKTGWNITEPFEMIITWVSNIGKPKMKVHKKSYSKSTVGAFNRNNDNTDTKFPNQEEVDYLLDKISVNGYESLTKTEKERLFVASQNKD